MGCSKSLQMRSIPSSRARPATPVNITKVFGASVGADGDANEDEKWSQKYVKD